MKTTEDFDFKKLNMYIGCMVEVSSDPTENSPALGHVTHVGPGSVSIMCVSKSNITGRRACWHVDDPRCKASPEVFETGNRGVFRLAKSELRARATVARLEALEKAMEGMVGDIADVKRRVPTQDTEPAPKAKPRKPKKPVPETAGV